MPPGAGSAGAGAGGGRLHGGSPDFVCVTSCFHFVSLSWTRLAAMSLDHSPVWLTPYSACSGVYPSYSSWSMRPECEKDVNER